MKKEDADQLIRCVKECWWRLMIFIAVELSFVVLVVYGWPNLEKNAVGWAQVAVAFAAAASVVAIYIKQTKQRNREKYVDLSSALEAGEQVLIDNIVTVKNLYDQVKNKDTNHKVSVYVMHVQVCLKQLQGVPLYQHPYGVYSQECGQWIIWLNALSALIESHNRILDLKESSSSMSVFETYSKRSEESVERIKKIKKNTLLKYFPEDY